MPLTLETATPTFQVGIPTLYNWTLSANRPVNTSMSRKKGGGFGARSSLLSSAPSGPAVGSDEDMGLGLFSKAKPLRFRDTTITSKGNVSATFTVPGTITIPSDNAAHNVTITRLELDATMSWIAVPKVDARVRLSVR